MPFWKCGILQGSEKERFEIELVWEVAEWQLLIAYQFQGKFAHSLQEKADMEMEQQTVWVNCES